MRGFQPSSEDGLSSESLVLTKFTKLEEFDPEVPDEQTTAGADKTRYFQGFTVKLLNLLFWNLKPDFIIFGWEDEMRWKYFYQIYLWQLLFISGREMRKNLKSSQEVSHFVQFCLSPPKKENWRLTSLRAATSWSVLRRTPSWLHSVTVSRGRPPSRRRCWTRTRWPRRTCGDCRWCVMRLIGLNESLLIQCDSRAAVRVWQHLVTPRDLPDWGNTTPPLCVLLHLNWRRWRRNISAQTQSPLVMTPEHSLASPPLTSVSAHHWLSPSVIQQRSVKLTTTSLRRPETLIIVKLWWSLMRSQWSQWRLIFWVKLIWSVQLHVNH